MDLHILESSLKMSGLQLPVKSVIIKEEDRTLLISPLPNIKDFSGELSGTNKITDIVAPSGFHHLGVKPAKKIFPDAYLWGVPALEKKRKDIKWDYILGRDSWPFKTLKAIPLEGLPKVTEWVFVHKPTKSLIVSDLCFNHVHGKGLANFLLFNLFGTYKRLAMSRLFKSFIKEKDLFINSIHRLLDEEFDQIILPHGKNISHNGKERLKSLLIERGFQL